MTCSANIGIFSIRTAFYHLAVSASCLNNIKENPTTTTIYKISPLYKYHHSEHEYRISEQ